MNARRQHQILCYTIEGLNSFGTVLYFTYVYFLLHQKFGFGDRDNLAVAALLGLVYAVAAWQGGRFGQRHGNFAALKLGFGLMAASWIITAQLGTAAGQVAGAAAVSLGMCFTWPALEALVSEGETPGHIPHAVGIYTITGNAITNGGTIINNSASLQTINPNLVLNASRTITTSAGGGSRPHPRVSRPWAGRAPTRRRCGSLPHGAHR